MPQMAPNRAGGILVPTNPDLADILGRTDLNFENFYFFHFVDPKFLDFQVPKSGFPDFQKSGFPGSQISQIWPGSGQARFEISGNLEIQIGSR